MKIYELNDFGVSGIIYQNEYDSLLEIHAIDKRYFLFYETRRNTPSVFSQDAIPVFLDLRLSEVDNFYSFMKENKIEEIKILDNCEFYSFQDKINLL